MKFNNWSKEEIALLVELSDDDQNPKQIADTISAKAALKEQGFSYTRSAKAVERKREKLLAQSIEKSTNIDDRWMVIRNIQKTYREKSKFLDIGLPKTAPVKILSLSDIHFPFARTEFLKQAITDHADADTVVVNGDIVDGYIFSTFEHDKAVAAIDEYNCAVDFIYLLSQKFRRVVIVSGNHDIRVQRAVKRSGIDQPAHSFLAPDLLRRVANGERLNRDGTLQTQLEMKNVYYAATETWWVQIGKTLFIHPHTRGSSKPAYTVSGWAKKFQDRLPPGSFDSVVSGHTHQCSKHIQNNLMLIEQGCLSDYLAYTWEPKQMYHSGAMNGYAVIYQDNEGNTDFNKSGFVYLGQLLPIDKPMAGGGSWKI